MLHSDTVLDKSLKKVFPQRFLTATNSNRKSWGLVISLIKESDWIDMWCRNIVNTAWRATASFITEGDSQAIVWQACSAGGVRRSQLSVSFLRLFHFIFDANVWGLFCQPNDETKSLSLGKAYGFYASSYAKMLFSQHYFIDCQPRRLIIVASTALRAATL